MPRPPTWDHLKSAKKPLELRIPVYLNGEPIERLEKAREALEAAKTRHLALQDQSERAAALTPGDTITDTPVLVEAAVDVERQAAEVSAAEEAVRESTAWFVIRKITPRGRKRYEQLVKAHPPTDEQVKEAADQGQERPSYDAETFAPALLSASCVEPLLTLEEATELFDDWSLTECSELLSACLAVNTGRRTVDLGKG